MKKLLIIPISALFLLSTLVMPYANFDDVQSIKTLYNQSLTEDDDMNLFEFVGEKLLTANLGEDKDEDAPAIPKHIPLSANSTVQIQSGVLFQLPSEEIKLQQPKAAIVKNIVSNSAFYTQEFQSGIFHPPLVKFILPILNLIMLCFNSIAITFNYHSKNIEMKKLFIALSVMLFAIGVQAQTKVPAVVENAFKQKFSNATNVKWDKENKNEYEAEFIINGKKASANFNAKGELTESEMPIEINAVPASAVKVAKDKYATGVITAAYKIEKANGTGEYEIEVTVGKKTKELVFDKDWKLIK